MINEYFYFSILYEDTFDATAWRIIFSEPQPIPAYATMIYFKILTESTASKGVLLRDRDRAYTEEQLMAICGIRQNDPDQVKEDWRKAYRILIDERVIDVHEDGAIEVCLSAELFGTDSRSARVKRRQRERYAKVGEPSLKQREIDPERYAVDNERTLSTDCPTSDGQGEDIQIPLNEDESSSNPPNSRQPTRRPPDAYATAEAAAEFGRIYPKKAALQEIAKAMKDLTEEELEALLRAARRVAKDPSKTEQKGRFAQDPIKFIRSKPWTEDDLKAASDILWGKKQSAMLEASEKGEEGR